MPKPDPLVSVLICTQPSRPKEFLSMALECYHSQEWENKELILVDDADKNLATKRNIGAQMASGEFIIHFDDDDWSHPERIEDQVGCLMIRSTRDKTRDVIGYSRCYWWHRDKKIAAFYDGPIWGATLCYRRSYAIEHPWNETISTSEDLEFLRPARAAGTLIDNIDALSFFVATQHAQSDRFSYRDFTKPPFYLRDTKELPAGFRSAICRH